MTTTEKIVENTTLLAVSRLSMLLTPVLLGALAFLFNIWITDIAKSASNAADAAAQLQTRVSVLETSATNARADRVRYQDQVIATLIDIQRAQNTQGNQIAAVQATVEALKEQRSRAP